MRRLVAAIAVVATFWAGACNRDSELPVALDGSPRVPDDEGVATSLSRERITLDGERTYEVSRRLVSFSTYDRRIEPMLGRRGQYVQVGLDDGKLVWMAGIAAVVPTEDGDAVFYNGRLVGVEAGRATFADGTVLRLAPGVEVPEGGETRILQARIDPARHRVVELR